MLPPGPVTNASAVAGEAVPAEVRALAEQTVPGMTIAEAERKEREGRVYYDVEGTRPDGSEVELDMLEEKGAFRVVEIQRDIAWSEAPAAAIAAARAAAGAFAPERVIESTQTDGTVIYELFAPGRTDEPAMEVRMKDGKAELLGERWAH
ncbi:hypothetical protein D1610_09800 [Sphingomonas gilva]|uniref:PepSY domain-containing protein n=1 Tax=Sphingomonas gilva TaxID=2305907 RepID=A0A396RN85_9SPHN|nr:hypothetical protein D1610_09800 [Sphingomonas gilva]